MWVTLDQKPLVVALLAFKLNCVLDDGARDLPLFRPCELGEAWLISIVLLLEFANVAVTSLCESDQMFVSRVFLIRVARESNFDLLPKSLTETVEEFEVRLFSTNLCIFEACINASDSNCIELGLLQLHVSDGWLYLLFNSWFVIVVPSFVDCICTRHLWH